MKNAPTTTRGRASRHPSISVVPVASCHRAPPSAMEYLMRTPATSAHTRVSPYSAPAMVDDTISPTPMPVAASSRPGPMSESFTGWLVVGGSWFVVGSWFLTTQPRTTNRLGRSASQHLGFDRQLVDALSGRRGNRVDERSGRERRAGLADAARLRRARDDEDLDLGHLVVTQHLIVVEVTLHHTALVDRDLALERRGQPVDDATLHLGF